MATTENKILLKKSSVSGKIPGASAMEFGELALNFSDGRLYFKNSNNEIDFFQTNSVTNLPLPLPFAAKEGDLGKVADNETYFNYNLESITQHTIFTYNLGNLLPDGSVILPSFTASNLPPGAVGSMIFITDEIGGPSPAVFDGNNWKRVYDNQIISPS
jgi:hypothetical protein